ncbi:MAG: hypothetical protein KatS3mg060_2312 [Dehalococcoidia bacterium]|nr:MAG: hypothetical protein KatS3mg060_2312 [Dehalococcoidia bacterium]
MAGAGEPTFGAGGPRSAAGCATGALGVSDGAGTFRAAPTAVAGGVATVAAERSGRPPLRKNPTRGTDGHSSKNGADCPPPMRYAAGLA